MYRTLKRVPLFSSSTFLSLRKSGIFEGETANLMRALNSQQCAVVLHSRLNFQTQGMRIQTLGDLEENNQIGTTDTETLPCPTMHCPALVWAGGEGGVKR